jgi:hypothetical protein
MNTTILDESVEKYVRNLKENYGVVDGDLLNFLVLAYTTKTRKLFEAKDQIIDLQNQLLVYKKEEIYGDLRKRILPIEQREISLKYQDIKAANTFSFSSITGLLVVEISTRLKKVVHDACKELAEQIAMYDKFEPVEYCGTLHFNSKGDFWVTLQSTDGIDSHKFFLSTGIVPEDVQYYFK